MAMVAAVATGGLRGFRHDLDNDFFEHVGISSMRGVIPEAFERSALPFAAVFTNGNAFDGELFVKSILTGLRDAPFWCGVLSRPRRSQTPKKGRTRP